jgi:hypothetical protein
VETGLVVVGGADSSLRLSRRKKKLESLTQVPYLPTYRCTLYWLTSLTWVTDPVLDLHQDHVGSGPSFVGSGSTIFLTFGSPDNFFRLKKHKLYEGRIRKVFILVWIRFSFRSIALCAVLFVALFPPVHFLFNSHYSSVGDRIWIRMFLDLLDTDPDLSVRGMDPDPSIIKKNLPKKP